MQRKCVYLRLSIYKNGHMKKIYRPLIKGTNWVLAGLLSLLGFSNCKKIPYEYGVPWGSYAIQGKVTDKATDEPIQGIEVRLVYPPHLSFPPSENVTDNNGDFKLPDVVFVDSIPLIATDIDGEKNGLYRADTIYVDYGNAKHIGGGDGWFQGELVATADFKLEAVEPDE